MYDSFSTESLIKTFSKLREVPVAKIWDHATSIRTTHLLPVGVSVYSSVEGLLSIFV